jgi:putative FmdB family regulatory protein
MPTYTFTCPHCGYKFERQLSFTDSHDGLVCPHCGAGARRVFSPPAVVFKGSGYYITDHHKTATPAEE